MDSFSPFAFSPILVGDMHVTFPVIFTLLVCMGVTFLAHWVSRQRVFPGRVTFVMAHIASLWWMLSAAREMAVIAPEAKLFWAAMAWPGIIFMPTFWVVFLWQYVNSVHTPIKKLHLLLLSIMPVFFWLIAMTNPSHQLFYIEGTGPINNEVGAPIHYEHGLLFYLSAVYVYVFMMFCVGVLVRAAIRSKGLHRRHYLAFIAVSIVPWVANISYVVFGWTIFEFDPTPFSFAFVLVAFAWLIVGVRLFDLLPVARHLLLESLLDPVLVIDPYQRVIEANPAARSLAGFPEKWLGRDLNEWPVFGAALQQLLAQYPDDEREHLLTLGNCGRYYEVRARAIKRDTREGAISLGQMLYLRDVTQRHLSDLKLAEALKLSEERLKTISNLHELLREQALRDPLTGLYNRRYLDELFALELARAQRKKTSIALALLDLDHFKQLNDEHGHLIGDDVLKSVASYFLENVRSTDAVFRIGGEEFLLILPEADSTEAFTRLKNLCAQLATTPMQTRIGEIQITCSAGLAHWPTQGQSLDELILKADAALYSAKRAGRNCVRE
ncbi:MAG: histidine kinase N-terminal 7TM domain-containing protein [Cellvibrio sp.]|uniref:histidine kinase N-terminal 7TM domain-containing diguanylate cyclase n=1 Tax=Cellvibrio sp. TaxID=1965322 RepID=UPI0031A5BC21